MSYSLVYNPSENMNRGNEKYLRQNKSPLKLSQLFKLQCGHFWYDYIKKHTYLKVIPNETSAADYMMIRNENR